MTITYDVSNLTANPAPLYLRYTGQTNPQPAYVQLDEDGFVYSYASGEIGDAVPMRVHHNRSLRWPVQPTINGQFLAELLQGDARPLLERIHAGHTVEWDGNNMVGMLDDDATAASEELEQMLDGIADDESANVEVWNVNDWLFSACSLQDHWSSEQSLDEAVKQLTETAEIEGICLDGDIRDCLLRRASREFEEWGSDLSSTHLAALVSSKLITQEQADARLDDE